MYGRARYGNDFDGSDFEFNRTKISFQLFQLCVCVRVFQQFLKKVKPPIQFWLSKCKRFCGLYIFTVCLDWLNPLLRAEKEWNRDKEWLNERKKWKGEERKTIVCSIRTVDNNALNVKYIALSHRSFLCVESGKAENSIGYLFVRLVC